MTNEAHIAELFKAFNVPQVEADQCPMCGTPGESVRFEQLTVPLEAPGGYRAKVTGLSGTVCAACGEVIMDAESGERFAKAGDALVLHARQQEAKKLRAARVSLWLTQEAAGLLTGGGHNAFSRYETGQAVPVPAVGHLMGLLAKHPELGNEIPGVEVVEVATAKMRPGRGRYRLMVAEPNQNAPEDAALAAVGIDHLVAAQQSGKKDSVKRSSRGLGKRSR
ncbi:MAG TPA: hypothetical protein DDZ74_20045 [Pseudomonas sp.]|uniref:type II TA system antitoxin MqsA family protein n=1 Tax=Stenotrophomonas sp. SMYL28 TaxID=3076049 RepID=UPI000E7E5CF0|nr:type II TA system antitoxin MqsA family protein [Stenotrophomonas sp. SMYL28]HBK51518.1 hypothetical protein [Pseudomonas sp.]HEL3245993.1 type II toxin-antitoxin system MqsA family antitoxin [Stenotrophomonas maltophilia]HEL4247964.1 type II toxin-antitoxin system MqsA family antitoxin [Stenotrophomonas maltophilia]HEL4251682.1 type II toxin-antitoxin system MqsA family antitoxin [Stenotrophomonas maltophilia]HEL7612303.1 type II toxin-antitoxin system MqsA family antitoxin [Stenotrophomon